MPSPVANAAGTKAGWKGGGAYALSHPTVGVKNPAPHIPWSWTKTLGNNDDEQVVVIVSLPLLPLPSCLRLLLPPYSSRRVLLVLSAVTWHRPSSSFGWAAVAGDVAVKGALLVSSGGCDVAWLAGMRGGVEGL